MRIAVTPGEPAGIGPDIVLQLALISNPPAIPIAIADPELLRSRAALLKLPVTIQPITPQNQYPTQHQRGHLTVLPITLAETVIPGTASPANAEYILQTLRTAVSGCLRHDFAALVTGPINKAIINMAGITFTGHTEFLAELTGSTPVMMLAADKFRVALATTHLPLSAVSRAITTDKLETVITILNQDLQTHFHIPQPTILVAGLNPHAGESGHMGREEIDTIQPVLEKLRHQGLRLIGPLPADTLFTHTHLQHCDAVLAMYHDQGLPVLKYAAFGKAVNITLGLPIIRTSVDHGTAFELAGSGKADASSLIAAFNMAADMAHYPSTIA